MRETALLLVLLAAAYVGFALLALSQRRHWTRAIGEGEPSPEQARRLRILGYALLAIAFVLAVLRDGASFGIVLWATAISIAAIAVALTLTWRPRWVRALAAPLGLPDAAP